MESILAVDIGSGGVTSALIDPGFEIRNIAETAWTLEPDAAGVATLSARDVLDALEQAVRTVTPSQPSPDALVLSSMMHTLVVTDRSNSPLTPVFTWLDTRDFAGSGVVEERLGNDYTRRTGTWWHPCFPAFKIARLRRASPHVLSPGFRVHSLRSWIQFAWTGVLAEDTSTASASGLLNLASGDWDRDTLEALDLDAHALLPLTAPRTVVGELLEPVAARLGLPRGLRVVAGGGDGFFASLGSGCSRADRLAITLGTSSGVRCFRPQAPDVSDAGLFCYRFDTGRFLVGCASNNGGNLLDWARAEFGAGTGTDDPRRPEPPVFLPFLFGERAPFWDTSHVARWLDLSPDHDPADMARSVVEAVTFTLATYCRLVSDVVGTPSIGVLSGNGFHTPGVGETLAALVPFPIVVPPDAGAATLMGAAQTAFEAVGVGTATPLEDLLGKARPVEPTRDARQTARFERFATCYMDSIEAGT